MSLLSRLPPCPTPRPAPPATDRINNCGRAIQVARGGRHGGLQEAHFKDTFSKIITAKEIEGRNKGNEPAAKKAKK